MNVRNCKNCGKIFNYFMGPPVCPNCKESMEAKFQEVKEYVRVNKGSSIQEVAEACDVEPSQIRQWLREERLELTDNSSIMMPCESCGAPIQCGRFCNNCKRDMANQFSNSIRPAVKAQPEQKKFMGDNKNKMRYLER